MKLLVTFAPQMELNCTWQTFDLHAIHAQVYPKKLLVFLETPIKRFCDEPICGNSEHKN